MALAINLGWSSHRAHQVRECDIRYVTAINIPAMPPEANMINSIDIQFSSNENAVHSGATAVQYAQGTLYLRRGLEFDANFCFGSPDNNALSRKVLVFKIQPKHIGKTVDAFHL